MFIVKIMNLHDNKRVTNFVYASIGGASFFLFFLVNLQKAF